MKAACPEFVVHYDPEKHTVKWISSLSRRKGMSFFINIHYEDYGGYNISQQIPNSRRPLCLKEFFRGELFVRSGTAAKLFICTKYINSPCRSEEIEIVIPEILPSLSKPPDRFPTPLEALKKRFLRLKTVRRVRILLKLMRRRKLRPYSQSPRKQRNQHQPIVLIGSITTADSPDSSNEGSRPRVVAGSDLVSEAALVKASAKRSEGRKKKVSPVAKQSSTSSKRNGTTPKCKKPTTD